MKKIFVVLFSVIVCIGMLAGCGGSSGNLPDEVSQNDVLTMKALDKDKMTISIRAEYNVNNEAIRKALARKFPEVNFVSVFHCSQETQYELRQSLEGGTAEDIIISPNMKAVSDIASKYMLDVSGEDFTDKYIDASLEECQLDGDLYYLPGPSSVFGIVYDKTMFQQHGWKVPKSYSQFISLVKTINASGIRAIQPTCVYARQGQMVLTMFSYAGTFSGVNNAAWLDDYQAGKASMKGHMEKALKRYSELGSAGVIKAADFQMQPGNRSTMLYNDHTCAMIIENEQAETYATQQKSDHEYGMFPFWSGNGKNSDHLMSIPAYYMGINKSLENNAEKLSKVKEVVSYISSRAGQKAINGEDSNQISNIRGMKLKETSFNSGIMATINKGNLVDEVDFLAAGNNNAVEKQLVAELPGYLNGTTSASALMTACDKARDTFLADGINKGEAEGTAAKNFSVAETAQFIAGALKDKADADIGLCYAGTVHRGMVGRIYKGKIYSTDINALSLSVGPTSGDVNDKKLWKVSMTGKQIKALLVAGYKYDPADNVPNIPYYVASGLKIKFAPWQDEKIKSVTLSDGSELRDGEHYTVALWGWPFTEKCSGTVEKVYNDTSEAIITDAVKKAGTLDPSDYSDFEIVYDR
jgi:raffinose/stachyose/melibiose transport system substrate-binding protein